MLSLKNRQTKVIQDQIKLNLMKMEVRNICKVKIQTD